MSSITLSDEALFERPDEFPSRMSEDEFVAWNFSHENARVEWVNGEVIQMSPVSARHVMVFMWLSHVVDLFVRRTGLGKAFGSEFTARLRPDQRTSRRQPDLMFIAKDRLHLIRKNHLEGPPDLTVEIVSPDSRDRDWKDKFEEYESTGVREYWIIDPETEQFEAFKLNPIGKLISFYDQPAGLFASELLTGFKIQIEWLWAADPPDAIDVLKGLGIIN